MDFDKLVENHRALSNEIISLNDQLKYWTNELILRDSPLETVKILCIIILAVFIQFYSLIIKEKELKKIN